MNDLISREEAAKRLETQAEKWKGSYSGEAFEFAAKIVRGVPSATDNDVAYKMKATADNLSWIPVTERLPEELPENEGKKVIPCLVSLKSTYPNGKPNTQKRQRQLQYYGGEGWKWEWSRIGAYRVTHWMPLPEAPKGE